MSSSQVVIYSWPAADVDGICLSQAIIAGNRLQINPASAFTFFNGSFYEARLGNINRLISLSSATDLTMVQFEIKGYLEGLPVSEIKNGPNAGTTNTVKYYDTITSITPLNNLVSASQISIGLGAEGFTNWFFSNVYGMYTTTFSANIITDLIDYTLQATAEPLISSNLYAPDITGDMTGATVSKYVSTSTPFVNARFKILGAGVARFVILQSVLLG